MPSRPQITLAVSCVPFQRTFNGKQFFGQLPMPWLWSKTPFVLFGPAHLCALALTAVAAIALALTGRRIRQRAATSAVSDRGATESEIQSLGSPVLRRLSRGLAVVVFLILVPMQIVILLPAHFDVGRSLPLQICDIGWMAAIYALWTYRRWAFALVYYWGLTATLLAMLTPDLKQGFPQFPFLLFYLGHGTVVVAGVYLCWGVGLRPDWRLYRLTAIITIAYAVCIFFVNRWLGTNFFCVNGKPPPGTMLDYFGPYPMHILLSALIALSAWAALTWPWQYTSPKR